MALPGLWSETSANNATITDIQDGVTIATSAEVSSWGKLTSIFTVLGSAATCQCNIQDIVRTNRRHAAAEFRMQKEGSEYEYLFWRANYATSPSRYVIEAGFNWGDEQWSMDTITNDQTSIKFKITAQYPALPEWWYWDTTLEEWVDSGILNGEWETNKFTGPWTLICTTDNWSSEAEVAATYIGITIDGEIGGVRRMWGQIIG